MKKVLYILIVSLLFISCTTPPAEKKIVKTRLDDIYEENNLKIYIPEFTTFDSEKNKVRAVYGDGMVIILPNNKVIVLDSFDSEAKSKYIEFLNKLNIKKIDYLILSHYHSDHAGNMIDILNNFEIDTFYHNGIVFSNYISSYLPKYLNEKNIKQVILKEGDSLEFDKNCNLKVFWPNYDEDDILDIQKNPGKTAKKQNNTSLVFKLNFNKFSMLFTGDVYKSVDKILSKKYGKQLHSTILKAPHHGEFYTANSLKFVKTVSPDLAIIQDNRYVNPIISNIYRFFGSKILYRKTDGYIKIVSDGFTYSISQETF